MADFIEITELRIDLKGYDQDVKRLISKYHITEIMPDEHHNQTFIHFRGQEIRIRESLQKIQEMIRS